MNNQEQYKKVLVTGGAGFIGSHLCEALIKNGHAVTVIDNLSTGTTENLSNIINNKRFKLVIEDILNQNVISALIQNCDLIYHLAAGVGVKLILQNSVKSMTTNIHGTEIILRCANSYKKPILITSTSEVYGKNEKVPFNEDNDIIIGSTQKSRWSYACSKALNEFLALSYYKEQSLPVVIVRLFNTVGPRQVSDYGMVLPSLIERALSGRPLIVYGDGQQTRSFCYVSDVISALTDIIHHQASWGKIFNIGNPEEISILNLAKMIKSRLNSPSVIELKPYHECFSEDFEDMKNRCPDISKIKDLIDFQPSEKIESIIDNIVEYYRNRIPLNSNQELT